jgi:membrane-bound lytic murein transglycosylase MltF
MAGLFWVDLNNHIMLMNTCLQTHLSAHSPARTGSAIVAAAVLALGLFACAVCAKADAESAPETLEQEQLTITLEKTLKTWTGDLDAMIERRIIRILVVHSKTFYFVDKGVQRGASYDMGRLFVEDLNNRLAKDNKLKQKHLHRDELLSALVAGKGDIAISGVGVTEERLKQVDFSSPVLSNVSAVVVSGPGSATIASLDDLAGKQFFVRRSSVYYDELVALNKRFAAEKKPLVIINEAPETLEDEDLVEMVNAGLIPFTVSSDVVANFWKQVYPAITVHDNVTLRTGGDIAWAIRKGSPQLKVAVDEFTVHNAKGTLIGNQILTKYLKNTKYVMNANAEAERKKFISLIEYFKKYGEQYDVDWLLMASQGYQESQLNQDAKSAVGAIGVMQVMPATGKDLNVGDISQVEANINAGIKYMRWMINNYYEKEPMTDLDKALFAFASYNCGAGRVSQLRKEATRLGLDPNVWFQNVEYVAAEKVGAETVTYVSNIFKYYVAYKLIMESMAQKAQDVEQLKGPNLPVP